jgi:hypothetical protein
MYIHVCVYIFQKCRIYVHKCICIYIASKRKEPGRQQRDTKREVTRKHTRETTDLEGDGEVAEALSEDPDNGVAEPGDDSDASNLRVHRARLASLGLGSPVRVEGGSV